MLFFKPTQNIQKSSFKAAKKGGISSQGGRGSARMLGGGKKSVLRFCLIGLRLFCIVERYATVRRED